MSTSGYLIKLKKKHAKLKVAVAEASKQSSFSSLRLSELKRDKLRIKDKIVRIEAAA